MNHHDFILKSEHELFVDLSRVVSLDAVVQRLHRVTKHPSNPLLSPARPWEVFGPQIYGGVVRDAEDGIFRMWYTAGDTGADFRYRTCGCLAVSRDGIHWERSDTDVFEYQTSPRSNIVIRAHEATGWAKGRIDGFCVNEDALASDPSRRFKQMMWEYNTAGGTNKYDPTVSYPSGLYPGWSADGLHWEQSAQPTFVMADGYGDTSFNFMVDTLAKRYVSFLKVLKGPSRTKRLWRDGRWLDEAAYVGEEPADANPESVGIVFRHRAVSTSPDFLHWSEPKEILTPDGQDPADLQWYNNTGFVCGSQYLGLIEAYYPATTDTIDIQLISSRDGTTWERCFDRLPFIANGEFDREWDWGCIYVPGSPPVRVGDELYFYYSGFGMRHGTPYELSVPKRDNPSCRGIGLATLRLDGFVSLHAGSAGGRVLTAPVRIDGDNLQVNAQCRGELRVEILDENQRPISGFSFEDCQPLTCDSVSLSVRWKGGSLTSLRGKSVHLHFQLQDVDLYSYWSI